MFQIRNWNKESAKGVVVARQSLYLVRRQNILDAIEQLSVNGRSPSLREVSDTSGVSIASLHSYLHKMRKEGVIEWAAKSHRSLKIVSGNLSSPVHRV